MQICTTEKIPLLDGKGKLTRPSYGVEDVFTYNYQNIKGCKFGKKEWEFYQVSNRKWLLQLTYGHTSYVGNVNVSLIELDSGVRHDIPFMKFFPRGKFDLNFGGNDPYVIEWWEKDFLIKFEVTDQLRRLQCKCQGKVSCDIDLIMPNSGNLMCIATPFSGKKFYYNVKKNFLGISGHVVVDNVEYSFDEDTFALVDSGRGVWPYTQEWYWGSASTKIDDHIFGFNIGWGFGDTTAATENMLFVDGVAHKLEKVSANFNTLDYMAPVKFTSSDGRFEMEFTPKYNNFTETDFKIIHNRCNQVFGTFSGTAILDDKTVVNLFDVHGFCEHAENRW